MLNVKKLLTKILIAVVPSGGNSGQVLVKNSNTNYDVGWTTPLKVLTDTVSGTTNGNGAISLASKIPITAEVLSVRTASNANYMCIPWVYNNTTWYCKVVDWQSMASQNNKSISLTIKYIKP